MVKQTKRQKNQQLTLPFNQINLKNILPKTPNQKKVFEYYKQNKNILLDGIAGCGKTFLSLFLSLSEILEQKSNYEKIYIIRSVVPSRDIGFLPGSAKEKSEVYETPYKIICSELFNRGDAYEILTKKDIINFDITSFLRGTTYKNCILIIDEVQNMNFQEINTILTRVGDNCRILICGDIDQTDLDDGKSGFKKLVKIFQNMKNVGIVNFEICDILRSDFVKEYLETKYKLNL